MYGPLTCYENIGGRLRRYIKCWALAACGRECAEWRDVCVAFRFARRGEGARGGEGRGRGRGRGRGPSPRRAAA